MRAKKCFLAVVAAILILAGCTTVNDLTSKVSETISPSSAVRASDGLVIDSLKALEILKNREDRLVFLSALKNAAGVAIFPAVYKAGFFVGAEGGNGLIMARDTQGNWGYPAFYTLAGGSWGIQFGGQRAGVVLILRSRKAVEAVLKHQGKAGADLGIALGSMGAGLEGSTTTNLAADIVAFSDAKGLFGGVSLEGTAIVRRNDLNREYYGAAVTPAAILIEHAYRNAQADTLRNALTVR
ncbi:MAG: hypothetical protein CBD27_10275 [Rhodospirillaceae bacterium TMED167]|nr:hypothetical protein [Rhodospirillaceae bacterium]OUW24923.1 MAG: hypothetical protein CBD27_10275 [Rhodospirillaceae bacterium TMED167]